MSCGAAFVLLACASLASASSFLSRLQNADEQDVSPKLEATILDEIEHMLSGSMLRTSEARVARNEEMLRTTFMAMPKNRNGKLGHETVRYMLHSFFLQKHAWYVRGLAAEESANSSLTGVLQDRVEEFVQGAFERRLGTHGLDLREIAVLAVTYENLVHSETVQRLNATYAVMGMEKVQELGAAQLDLLLDTYMMGFLLNLNFSSVAPRKLEMIQNNINRIYPSWKATQRFVKDVREKRSFHRSYFSHSDVESIVEDLGDQYGRWQDQECQELKTRLMALEDKSIGVNGSGRVRLADFYRSALKDGNYQFSETQEYLTQLGALDLQDPKMPRVMIANYVNSPTNCLASSKFYSVCCINECESLMDHIEHRFAAPTASPAEIGSFVASLPSSTVSAGRTLHPILISRLDEIANHHGGQVPLHGRLFAQWLHHAYPRECPYPHLSGTIRPQNAGDYRAQSKLMPIVTKEDMATLVQEISSDNDFGGIASEEVTAWDHEEELYAGHVRDSLTPSLDTQSSWQFIRPLAYLSVVVTAVAVFVRPMVVGSKQAAFLAFGLSGGGGKDYFV